jgi:RND family efflux transporter MFP subunit
MKKGGQTKVAEPASAGSALPAIKTTGVPVPDAVSTVRVLVLPAGETTLASPVAGRIVQLHAELGKSFKKGEVLIYLDCEEPQARLAMARSDLAGTTEQHEAKLRMQGLEQASDVEVALAASAVVKAKAQIDLLQFQISQCAIRAPWSGRIAGLHVRNFMTISPGLPLLDLVQAGNLRLKLNVPSRWLTSLKPGMRFDVTIDETGKTYPAHIRLVNGRVDPVSQTIELEAALLTIYPGLLPGMSGVSRFSGMS